MHLQKLVTIALTAFMHILKMFKPKKIVHACWPTCESFAHILCFWPMQRIKRVRDRLVTRIRTRSLAWLHSI